MAALEKKLHILRTEVYSLAVASVEPVTAYKFNRDYEENFCCDIDYRPFGYCSLEKFFDDHPQLEAVMVDGRRCYRVKVTAECSELRQLVSKQKKKKRKNAPPKSQFQRNYHQRSFAPRGSARQYPNMGPRSSMRGAPSMPFSFSRPPMSLNNGFTQGPTNFGNFGADTNFSANKTNQKRNVGLDPAKGVDRVMQALRKCGGRASHILLSKAYEELFRRPLIDDMVIYFGGKSMRIVHQNHLQEKANLINTAVGWMLVSTEIASEREAWNTRNQSVLQKVERTFVWDKPSLPKLYNNVVEMLINIYPAQLKVEEMSTIYERSYDVGVDPMKLYAKTWKALISTTFREKLEITGNDTVALRAAFVKSRGVTEKRPAATQRTKTAADLGFDSPDSDGFDSDDDVSVDSSSVANSSQLTESLPDSPVSMSRPNANNIPPPSFVSPTTGHTSTLKVQAANCEVKPVPAVTSTKKYPTYFGFARLRPSSQAQPRRPDPVSPNADATVPSVTPSPPSGVMPASIGNGLVPAANKYQQNAAAFDDTPVNCFGGSRFETSNGLGGGANEGNGVDSFTRAVASRRSANFVLAKPDPSSVFARLSYRKPKEDEQPASSAAQFGKWSQPEVRPRQQEVSAEQKESGTTSTELPQPKKKSGLAGFGSSMKKAISNRLGLTTVKSESSSSVEGNKPESSVSAQPPAESRAPAPAAPSQPFQFQVKFKGNREDVRAKLFPAH